MKKLLFLCLLCCGLNAPSQEIIDLAGAWDFKMESSADFNYREAKFDDYVILSGSMLTHGKGNPVSVKTQWTGSLYDSSYYFNPYMEKYRHEGQMKFPFFLTPDKHYVGAAWYRKTCIYPVTGTTVG